MHTDRPLANYIYRMTNNGTKIGTARDCIPAIREGKLGVTTRFIKFAANIGAKPQYPLEDVPLQEVHAIVNYGRWVVKCPDCMGCEDVDPAEPIFFCLSCGQDGYFKSVVFPTNRAEIEEELLKRPVENRNWDNTEDVKFLKTENIENGVN